MKLRQLKEALQDVAVFEQPKIALEQYPTTAELAAHLLYTAQMSYGDIEGKVVGDLGVGSGVLTIGAMLLDAAEIWAFDIDEDALRQTCVNIESFDTAQDERIEEDRADRVEGCYKTIVTENGMTIKCIQLDIVGQDVPSKQSSGKPAGESILTHQSRIAPHPNWVPYERRFDTVMMNPPFGTRLKGADLIFVEAACYMAKTAIYSLHKSSTRSFIQTKFSRARKDGWSGQVIAQLRFNIEASYSFHKKASADIEVDLWRFSRDAI